MLRIAGLCLVLAFVAAALILFGATLAQMGA